MKRLLLIICLIVAIFVVILHGCRHLLFGIELPYKFRQEYDQIVKIEILKRYGSEYDPARVEVLKTLDVAEHRTFIDDLIKVEGSRVGAIAVSGFGAHIIRITYRNGEIELIGPYNNGYVSVDGRLYTDCYVMDKNQFYDLLSRVLGEVITPPTLG